MPKEYTLVGGTGTDVSPLEVTENGTYKAGDSRAFNPVIVRTGGSSTLAGLTDVDLTNPTDGQTLVYDAASSKWVNGSGGGGYTLLHGTYDVDTSSIALTVTASELYTLMQTSIVAFDYTDGGTSQQLTNVVIIQLAKCEQEVGYDDVFSFSTADLEATDLDPDDVVVFSTGK